MNARVLVFATACVLVTLASACSGGGGGIISPPFAPSLAPVTAAVEAPSGNATAAGAGIAWDITRFAATISSSDGGVYDTLTVAVTFAQNVANALPSPGLLLQEPTQLGVAIFLDTDGNPSTGYAAGCLSNVRPFEYQSDDGATRPRLAEGSYLIINDLNDQPLFANNGQTVFLGAATAVSGNTFTQTFPLSAFGLERATAPRIGLQAVAYNGNGGPTDCAPLTTELFV